MGAGHQKDQAMTSSLEHSSFISPTPYFGEGLQMELWLVMCTWRSLYKVPTVWSWDRLQAGEHIHTGKVTNSNLMETKAHDYGTLRDFTLCVSSSVSFIIPFNKLVNISVSLRFVRCSSKFTEPKNEIIGNSNLQTRSFMCMHNSVSL